MDSSDQDSTDRHGLAGPERVSGVLSSTQLNDDPQDQEDSQNLPGERDPSEADREREKDVKSTYILWAGMKVKQISAIFFRKRSFRHPVRASPPGVLVAIRTVTRVPTDG